MRAFHCNWTAPFRVRNPHAAYRVEPYELLTTVLSAVFWQKNGGSIAMLCDSTAAAYYRACGLDGLWDGGIRPVLDDMPADIDPHIFWAGGKLYALRAFGAPCVMLDTDFIVWQPIDALVDGAAVAVIHREDLMPDVYPGQDAFPAAAGFDFSGLDWTVRPANTALAYFGDAAFTELYTERALSFMRAAGQADNALTYMVFAEQRLLAMLARQQHIRLTSLSELPALFLSGQKYFTHVWGFKQQMHKAPALLHDFCCRCAARLQADAPDWAARLRQAEGLQPFFGSPAP